MSDYMMPDDVLTKILAYLPAKSLVRFTCVCKSWQSLITSSDFITAHHLNRTRLSNNDDGGDKQLLFLRYYPGNNEKERYSFRVDNHTFDEYDLIECPFQSRGFTHYFRVLGSCNGLICLSDDNGPIIHTVILWNPSIRKSVTLPCPNFTFMTHGPFYHAIGFGFDSRTNDFKVVRIVYLESEENQSPRVQLYKLSKGSWETITATVDPSIFADYMFTTQAFVMGAVHWPAFKRDCGSLIISFNMSDEIFLEMGLPAGVVEECQFGKTLPVAVCGEWLSFFHFTNDHFYKTCSVWVMKEYGVVESWTKLYTFDLNGVLEKMLGFRRNGEMTEILLATTDKELVSYDPETRQIEYFGIFDYYIYSSSYSFHVDAYVESLVLVGMQTDPGRTCDESEEEDSCYESEEEKEEQEC